jgi:hypothetical protein
MANNKKNKELSGSFVYEGVTYQTIYGKGVGDPAQFAQAFMDGAVAPTYYGEPITINREAGTYTVKGQTVTTLVEALRVVTAGGT